MDSQNGETPIRVLLVEDNPADARLLVESLRDAGPDGFRVTRVSRLAEAVERLQQPRAWVGAAGPAAALDGDGAAPDVVLLDLSLPDSTGLETARRIQAAGPAVPVVVLTGLADQALALRAVREGVQDYLIKGECEGGLAVRALRYAVERSRQEAARARKTAHLQLLSDLAALLVRSDDPAGVIGEIFPHLTRAADVACYFKFVTEGDGLRLLRQRGTDLPARTLEHLAPDRTLCGSARGQQQLPIVLNDVQDSTDRRAELIRGLGITAYACFPLFTGEHLHGTLSFAKRGAGQFEEDELALLQAMCDQIAIVIMRRKADEELRKSEARHRAVVETAGDAIITIDERGVIESVNPATERMFGYARDEMVGHNVSMLMPEPDRSEHDEHIRRYLRTGEAHIIGHSREVLGQRKDGSTFPAALSVSEFRLGGRRMFTGMHRDVSERRRLEQQILDAAGAEQQRIGQELHDGLCQQLLGTAFAADLLARRLAQAAPGESASAEQIAGMLRDSIQQARSLSHGLNPVNLDGGGLVDALRALTDQVTEQFRLACTFELDGDPPPPQDATTALHLYRISQEAISNAIRHGKAQCIDVRLTASNGTLTLSIRDDGKGVSPDVTRKVGMGMHTMAYRARVLGGHLGIRRASRRGTVVTCLLPLRQDRQAAGAAAATAAAAAVAAPAVQSEAKAKRRAKPPAPAPAPEAPGA